VDRTARAVLVIHWDRRNGAFHCVPGFDPTSGESRDDLMMKGLEPSPFNNGHRPGGMGQADTPSADSVGDLQSQVGG
jgi:hypothetical protein